MTRSLSYICLFLTLFKLSVVVVLRIQIRLTVETTMSSLTNSFAVRKQLLANQLDIAWKYTELSLQMSSLIRVKGPDVDHVHGSNAACTRPRQLFLLPANG